MTLCKPQHTASLAAILPLILVTTGTVRADLNLVPEMTPVQAPVAAAIQAICPPLNSPEVAPGLTSAQRTLASSCTKMVQTSNAQQGSGGTALSLGLTTSGLRGALDDIAPEEMNAQNRSRTFTASAPINARLLSLRRGTGLGPLASSFEFNGQPIALAGADREAESGGGASADALSGGRWSGFFSGFYNWGKRDPTLLESGFDFDDYGFVTGADYRFSPETVAGLALSHSQSKSDFRNRGGKVESSNTGISAYASHSIQNGYIEGYIGYTKVDFDTARRIMVVSNTSVEGFDTVAKGSTKADQFSASIGGGYDWVRGNNTITPYARVSYLNLKVDGFTERENRHSLGLDIKRRSISSLQSALGVTLTKAVSLASGVITPYIGVEWNHEYRNNEDDIVAKYTHDPFNTFFTIPTASPDRDFFTIRAGLTSIQRNGLSMFANLDHIAGLKHTRSNSLTLGLRKEF